MKTKLIALAAMLVPSLLSSVAFADKVPTPDADTGQVITPNAEIKNARQCPSDTVFFKNAFPNLTNGPGSGMTPPTPLDIGGTTVWMTVSWNEDNSFGFDIMGGVAHRVGVTVDTNRFIYEYSPTPLVPVSNDQNLNWYMDPNQAGDDVAHLDLCLSLADPGDIVSPMVTITSATQNSGVVTVEGTVDEEVELTLVVAGVDGASISEECNVDTTINPSPFSCSLDTSILGNGAYTVRVVATDATGNTGEATVNVDVDNLAPQVTIDMPSDSEEVSGAVDVVATVTDPDSGVDSVTASVYPAGDPSSAVELMLVSTLGDVYTWTWDTEAEPAGIYEIAVSATDNVGNTTAPPSTITVEVVNALTACFGVLLEDSDLDPNEPEGCNPTGQVNLQAKETPDAQDTFFIRGELIQPKSDSEILAIGCDSCGVVKTCGKDALPDPRMKFDPISNRWYPDQIRPLVVFQEVGEPPENLPADIDPTFSWVIDQFTYGFQGCFGGAFHSKNWLNSQAYTRWPVGGLFFIANFFPEDTWETADRPVAKCYGPGPDQTLNLLESAEFLYQSTDKAEMVEGTATPYTEICGSGRTIKRGKSFDGWNLIETTAGIDFETEPEAVVQFKCDRIDMKFADLQTVVADAKSDLIRGKVSTAERFIKQAQSQAENCPQDQSLLRAYEDLGSAFEAWQKLVFEVTEANAPGDVLGRIGNLRYRIKNARDEILRLQEEGIL